jgi:cell division protease FtsH
MEVTTRFSDVAGCDEAIEELEEVVDFLKNPDRYEKLDAQVPRGILLMGSPGCGKTLLARAVAGEAGVAFISMAGSEFVERYVGVGAQRVRELFRKAQERAPAIIFIDEIDGVGQHRDASPEGGREYNQTLNQILTEMDGFQRRKARIVVIAATNRPDILDPALVRAGRFDRKIVIDPPDLAARVKILEIHTRKKPLGDDVDLTVIARPLSGVTGADLANIANEAALIAARRQSDVITHDDFRRAVERVLIGLEKKSRRPTAREREVAAWHEAGHALVAAATPGASEPEKITIIPRGMAGGYTLLLPEEERRFKFKHEFEAEIQVMLAGYLAEKLKFGEVTSGSASDRERATTVAYAMVTELGMSSLGLRTYRKEGFRRGSRDYGGRIADAIDETVDEILRENAEEVRVFLEENLEVLGALATRLLECETLERDEIERFLREHPLRQVSVSEPPFSSVSPPEGKNTTKKEKFAAARRFLRNVWK